MLAQVIQVQSSEIIRKIKGRGHNAYYIIFFLPLILIDYLKLSVCHFMVVIELLDFVA